MENYKIKVEYKLCDYLEEEEENDYRITIKIMTNDNTNENRNEEMIARFVFNASDLKGNRGSEIPENLEGDWSIHLCIESSDCYYIKKEESYVCFVSSTGSSTANTYFRLKYSSEIDEMIVKLREIYGLLN